MAERSSLERLQAEYDIDLDWRGFELHPETPPGGIAVARLFGASRVEGMREYMRRFAESFGIHDMRQPGHLPNTRRALAVAEYARDQGRLTEFRHAAMDAHWRRGLDLENESVLRELARETGLDADAVVAAMDDLRYLDRVDELRQEATRAGVTGIPTFFIGEDVVVGCQPYPVLAAAAERAGARRK